MLVNGFLILPMPLLGIGSKELVYQQVLRRFAHFTVMRLSTPAPLMELLMVALDEEERMGRWSECDGPKDQIAQVMPVVSLVTILIAVA